MHNQQKSKLALLPICGLWASWQLAGWQWGVRSVTALEEWGKGRQLWVHPPTPTPHPTALVLNQEPDYGVLIWLPHFTSLLGSDCCAPSYLASTRAVQALPSLSLTGWWQPPCHLGTGITFASNLPGAWQGVTSECWPRSVFKSAHRLNLCNQ